MVLQSLTVAIEKKMEPVLLAVDQQDPNRAFEVSRDWTLEKQRITLEGSRGCARLIRNYWQDSGEYRRH